MRFLPNSITVSRIFASFFLLITEPFTGSYFALYLFCGLSDILDGFLARRLGLSSASGATLDSIADCIFVFVALFTLLPKIAVPRWVLFWVCGILILKGITFVIGVFRYRGLAFLHTYLNKAAGGVLFCFPLMYAYWGITITASLLCGLATIAALEELCINIFAKALQRDRKGLFFK
jgi:CDP-diacylglycerol--glycerol-3-phosphate 3-phosphatidyltransferase